MHLKNECAARKKNVLHANGPERPKLKKVMKTKIRNAGVSATATRARRAVLATMFFLFGVVMVCACSFASEEENERQELVEVGQKLPAFAVVMNDSTLVSSTDLTGKPSMIVFFNTACTDCRKELPIVQELYEEFSDRINFMAISRAEGRESIAAYWEKEKLEIPYSAQADRNVFSLFAKTTIPRIYIADASGTVKYIFIEKASKKKLVRALETLLQTAT